MHNWGKPEASPHTSKVYAFHGIYTSFRTTSDKVRMREVFHVKYGVKANGSMEVYWCIPVFLYAKPGS